MLAGNDSGYVQVWNARTGERERTILGPGWGVEQLVFSPDGRHLFAQARGGAALYDTATWRPQPLGVPYLYVRSSSAAAFTPDGRALLVADGYNRVKVLEVASGRVVRELPRPTFACGDARLCGHGAQTVSITRDGRTVLVGYVGGDVALYNFTTGQLLRRLPVAGPDVRLTPDGALLVRNEDQPAAVTVYRLP